MDRLFLVGKKDEESEAEAVIPAMGVLLDDGIMTSSARDNGG